MIYVGIALVYIGGAQCHYMSRHLRRFRSRGYWLMSGAAVAVLIGGWVVILRAVL